MNDTTRPSETFDPDSWEGDFDELQPFQDELAYSEDLCETFYSKREAFAAGLYLGRIDAEQGPDPDEAPGTRRAGL